MFDGNDYNNKEYLITPIKIGIKEKYQISKLNFEHRYSPNFKGDKKFLIIGFDTEYQNIVVGDDEYADNEVLSYQYHCAICEVGNEDKEINWDGIIIPNSFTKEDRLYINEFIHISIGKGLSLYPKLKIPSEIYLVAHFTRADIPGFQDFKETDSRKRLNFDNIRNSFVNVGRDISVVLKDTEQRDVKLGIKVRDTITLAPTGKASLSNLGDVLGYNKIKLSEDPNKELFYKQNMKLLMKDNWELFKEYAIRDASICTYYTMKIMRLYKEQTNKFKLPLTLTSIGVDLIQLYWLNQLGVNPNEMVGKEEVSEKVWNNRFGQNRRTKKLIFKKKLSFQESLLTECYHGGRNEQYWFGVSHKDRWYDYDLTSAYPSAMWLIGECDWDDIKTLRSDNELLREEDGKKFLPIDMVFADINFEFPKSVRFPCLPVRTENGIIFPLKGSTATHISEIRLAQRLGCKISLNYGIKIGCKRHPRYRKYKGNMIGKVKRPFDGFTMDCINKRLEARHKFGSKGGLEELFWKELVNSTYGKTAQGLRERRVYDLKAEDTKRLKPSLITNPAYASFITAFCRGTLSEIMNNLPKEVDIFSVTTDGFLTTATPTQMEEATDGVLCKYYRSSRRVLSGSEKIFETKHIVKQLLGWRTRGQATIEESDIDDWKDEDIKSVKDDDRYVLAKAGIKTPNMYDKSEQNNEILKLFFERFPTQTIKVGLGKGIRPMFDEGLDFVNYEMTKTLSMEYDWKRKPHYVGEVPISIKGINCDKHLFFSTEPWFSMDEYYRMRDIFEQYNQQKNHNLKTEEDYNRFREYFDTQMSVDYGNTQKWLKKKDGVIRRLSRDLIIAEKLGKGGCNVKSEHPLIEKYHPNKRLKAKVYCKILTEILGIEITETDVTNNRKKKSFITNQTPNTDKSVELINKVKEVLFPKLKIDEFLTVKKGFTVSKINLDECISSKKLLNQYKN